jgi:hypothetical protein
LDPTQQGQQALTLVGVKNRNYTKWSFLIFIMCGM